MTQMGLPVLGRAEDAADSFAAVRLIRIGSAFPHRILAEATKGWFLSAIRDQKEGNKLVYYDEHGLDQQRAYQIVCLMVGSDDEKFKDLATETKLPKERQERCSEDYSSASQSWDLLLKPHLRAQDQPRTDIVVVYGDAKGDLAGAAEAARSIRFLETVAENIADVFAWPHPLLWKCRAAVFRTHGGLFPTTSLRCVTSWRLILQNSIAFTAMGRSMAASEELNDLPPSSAL